MNIDWTIVIAQIVNFVGLVWLLNRFLYGPVVNVISARESTLEERFARAETLQADAAREIADYEAKRRELERTRDEYLREAREEAARALADMLEDAEAEARTARLRLAQQLETERRELEQAVQTGLVTQVGEASVRVLGELAGRTVADGVIDAFEKRLRAAADGEQEPEDEGGAFAADGAAGGLRGRGGKSREAGPEVQRRGRRTLDLRDMKPPIAVSLSFVPDAEQRSRLRWMLNDVAGRRFEDDDIRFVHNPSLVLGLELHYDGSMLSWHARHVIGEWEAEALRRLARSAESEADGETGALSGPRDRRSPGERGSEGA